MQALKRLQRDAFEQLLRLDERVDAALGDADAGPGARAGAAPGASSGGGGGVGTGRAGARVSGALAAGAALLSLQARRPWASLACAGAGDWWAAVPGRGRRRPGARLRASQTGGCGSWRRGRWSHLALSLPAAGRGSDAQ